jgi:hypothetical protein
VTTGGALVLVGGAGVAVLGGALLLRRHAAAAAAAAGVPPTAPPAAVKGSPSAPAVVQLANGLQTLNQAGCSSIAGKYVPGGLGSLGCSVYTNWLSPIGATTKLVGAVERIPVVGAPIKSAVNGVVSVASKPISAIKNVLGSIF